MAKALTVFNTMSGRKERFEPLQPGIVKMFVCGPTVQGLMHLGHARTYIFYDVVARYLRHLGDRVVFIVNITDVDERITQAAKKARAEPMALARQYARYFLEDMRNLGIETVTSYERVSDYVPKAMEQIKSLMSSNHAYASDGWVYFDVSTFPDFGRLSHMSKEELSRRPLELSLKKKNMLDFSLWRPEELLEGKWRSPWGMGSPGWHIQDTAITVSRLGARYDIHGGAYELIYPHHEAEIAQGESLTGERPLVKYWLHTRLVNTAGEKMSKSAGNIYAIRDALKKFDRHELRYFFLRHHYREDVGLEGLEDAVRDYHLLHRRTAEIAKARSKRSGDGLQRRLSPFYAAMNDDFDTPKALDWLDRVSQRTAEKEGSEGEGLDLDSLRAVSEILGLDLIGRS